MKTSMEAQEALKKDEGFVPVAAPCPAGVPTNGYGFTLGVSVGDPISRAEADIKLPRELVRYEDAVATAINENCNQNEFDAMVSLAYNIGIAGFISSTVVRLHNAGNKVGAARAFGLWNKIHGVVDAGLVARRSRETARYLTPVGEKSLGIEESGEPTMPQRVDPEKTMGESAINRAGVIAGGTAAIATASQTLDAITGLKTSVSSLGIWLVPILLVCTIAAVGYMIWQRFNLRSKGQA